MAEVPSYLDGLFSDSTDFECPPLTSQMVQNAEAQLGYRLPAAYVQLLGVKNGGYFNRRYDPDHPEVLFEHVLGIGGPEAIDGANGSGSLIDEWGYPDTGVVISSDGHAAVMLDYSLCGPQGQPRVIGVEVESGEPEVVVLAPDLATFLARLTEELPGGE